MKQHKGPIEFAFYFDGDGTIYRDLILYAGLCEANPELNYYPTITFTEMQARFVHEQAKLEATGEYYSGPDVVNNTLLELVQEGRLPGLNNAVIEAAGAKHIKLFDGFVDFLKDARWVTETLSGGLMTTRNYVVTSNLRAGIRGSEIHSLTLGEHPLIDGYSGQNFKEREVEVTLPDGTNVATTEICGIIRSALSETKATTVLLDRVRGSRGRGPIKARRQFGTADGATDEPLFTALGKKGCAILVNDSQNPGRIADLVAWTKTKAGKHVRGPISNRWQAREHNEWGTLYMTLMSELVHRIENELARMGLQPQKEVGAMKSYVHTTSSVIHYVTHSAPSRRRAYAKEKLRARNLSGKLTFSPQTETLVRALSMHAVEAVFEPDCAQALIGSKPKKSTGKGGGKQKDLSILVLGTKEQKVALESCLADLMDVKTDDVELPPTNKSKTYDLSDGSRLTVKLLNPRFAFSIEQANLQVDQGLTPALALNGATYPLAVDFTAVAGADLSPAEHYPGRTPATGPTDAGIERGLVKTV